MPNGRCDTARREYDTAVYEKQVDVDKRIRQASLMRDMAVAGMVTAPSAAGASLLSGSFAIAFLGVGMGAFGALKFYDAYKKAQKELDDARSRCQQLVQDARDAFDRMLAHCNAEQFPPDERDRLRAEVLGLTCG
ncbi:MAG: hypothetical protein WD825_15480 [Gemmatimonadaceae bacterium]